MPKIKCKLDAYVTLCEDRDILDLDELDIYSEACGCADCRNLPPVDLPEDGKYTIELAS